MYFFDLEDYSPRCRTKEDIINDGGRVVENDNGTVTVFIQTTDGLVSQPLTKPCCETLGSVKGEAGIEYLYTFDIDTQECRWSSGCDNSTKPFKVVMNPLGNDGVIFNTNQTNNEKCTLRISFDYLFQIDCDDFMARLREANSTQGQDPRTLELISSLQSQQENCQRTLESLQTQLVVLHNELEATPFVIQCTNSVVVNVRDPIRYQTPIKPRGNLDVGFGTTRMMPVPNHSTTTYCLTDLGLQSWSNILGNNDYVTWFNSNGTNTTMYTCEDVDNLVTQDNFSGDLLGTCNVSLTARDEIWKEIVNIQKQILELEKNCERITSQLTELLPDVACSTVSEILETLNVAMTLDMVNPSTGALEAVYEQTLLNIGLGNLPTYLTSTTPNTGFYTTGTTGNTNCQNVGANLYQELLPSFPNSGTTEIQNLIINSFNSTWLQYETDITDQTLLDMIYNEKIKISFLVKDCCVNFGILVDRIKLTKICENVDNVTFDITKNPSFDMIRVIDNKKSWLANEDFEHREFELKFRDTQYDINNYKLVINTKEVDLDINPANAIEQDVFCYIRDNECLLECTNMSGATYNIIDIDSETCGDNCSVNLKDMMSTPMSEITTLEEFKEVFSSELIDVKHWKTQSSYPTLRLLYDRYLNSTKYCDTTSSMFNYNDMINFSELVGTYWVDLIEQVVPSTTIWGSTYIYGNTIFDQQKFQYKKYSLFYCELPYFGGDVVSPATGWTNDVEVIWESIENHNYDSVSGSTTGDTTTPIDILPTESGGIKEPRCTGVGVIQTNCDSEFIGNISVMGETFNDDSSQIHGNYQIFNTK